MHDCQHCNSTLPRENVFTQTLNSDERIVYIHCDFCHRLRVTLETRDGHDWFIATTSDLSLKDNAAMYRRELRSMHQAMSADTLPQEVAA